MVVQVNLGTRVVLSSIDHPLYERDDEDDGECYDTVVLEVKSRSVSVLDIEVWKLRVRTMFEPETGNSGGKTNKTVVTRTKATPSTFTREATSQ